MSSKNAKTYDCIIVWSGDALTSKCHETIYVRSGDDRDNDVAIYDSAYAELFEEGYFPQENVGMETNYTNWRLYGGRLSINGE